MPPGQGFENNGVRVLLFVDLLCVLATCVYGLTVFEFEILKNKCMNYRPKTAPTSTNNCIQNDRKLHFWPRGRGNRVPENQQPYEKNANAKNPNKKQLLFGVIFSKQRRVQRLDVSCGIWKMVIKLLGSNSAKKSRQKIKWVNLEPQNDLLKTSRYQPYSNYEGFVKSRVAARTLRLTSPTSPFGPFWPKVVFKWCLFWNPENRKLQKNLSFKSRSAPGPSKNCPKKRFWENMKNQRNIDRKTNVSRSEKHAQSEWNQCFCKF